MIIPFHNFTQIIIPFFLLLIIPTSTMQTFTNHTTSFSMPGPHQLKKLRRLPHVFSKVLEITPFTSDADVYVQEHHDCFIFIAKLDDPRVINGEVKVHVVEIHPGITKVVIDVMPSSSMDELNLDVWRFRLPGSARPELATVVYAHGELVVTVPKNGWGENVRKGGGGDCKGGFKGNMGNLILVQ